MNYKCLFNNSFIFKLFFYGVLALTVACDLTDQENNQPQYIDFSLEDINPISATHGSMIGPSFYGGDVSGYYFGDQGWNLCRARFGALNSLYEDLVSGGYSDIKIAGINGLDYIEGEISGMIQNRVLPWAQDNEDSHVWDTWNITLRDFIVLDINGDFFYKINLTDVDPSIESNYENLKQLLLDARSN